MEPILPEPTNNSNTAPNVQLEVQIQSGGSFNNTETAPNTRPDMPKETYRQPSQVQPLNPAPAPPRQVQPVMPMANTPMSSNAPVGDDPLIADDVDIIEKEWVDKAKRIVSATKDDPHTQEKEVSKLQADYLQKRYNKQLKLTE